MQAEVTLSDPFTYSPLFIAANSKEIHYLQSQNGNLYSSAYFEEYSSLAGSNSASASEFDTLRPLVLPEIEWCSEALGMYSRLTSRSYLLRTRY